MTSLQAMMREIRRAVRAAIAARASRGKPVPRAIRYVPAAQFVKNPKQKKPRLVRTHPDDEPIALELQEWHKRLNAERFNGDLSAIAVRVSRRMRSRLGHYAPAQRGAPAEIAISQRHVKKHGFAQGVQTLLHEMVHQWQDESRLPLGHGPDFRDKAEEVGIVARASRTVD
jgi:hypothetical protein